MEVKSRRRRAIAEERRAAVLRVVHPLPEAPERAERQQIADAGGEGALQLLAEQVPAQSWQEGHDRCRLDHARAAGIPTFVEPFALGGHRDAWGERLADAVDEFQACGLLPQRTRGGRQGFARGLMLEIAQDRLALLIQQAASAGQGSDRHIGEGLVAEGVVGVVVGQQQLQHGLVGDPSNGLAHGFAVAFRGAAVDHHYALLCDDKPGIDDIAAIALGEVVGAALQQPDAVGDLPGLQLIIQLGLGRAKRQA